MELESYTLEAVRADVANIELSCVPTESELASDRASNSAGALGLVQLHHRCPQTFNISLGPSYLEPVQ